MIATKIAEHFNFTLQALSFRLRILTDADLIAEKKQEKNRLYPVKRSRFLVDIYDYNLVIEEIRRKQGEEIKKLSVKR